jgi:hypothetical protein
MENNYYSYESYSLLELKKLTLEIEYKSKEFSLFYY